MLLCVWARCPGSASGGGMDQPGVGSLNERWEVSGLGGILASYMARRGLLRKLVLPISGAEDAKAKMGDLYAHIMSPGPD